MVRRYAVGSPADLMVLDTMTKSGTCANVARVWTVSKKQGKITFDGRVFVAFDTEARPGRHATVFRLGLDEELYEIAELKYNTALKWCAIYLRPVA